MPYWDKSMPEEIQERFHMSKAAFKRALGRLMKEGKIYQEEGWTYIKKESNKRKDRTQMCKLRPTSYMFFCNEYSLR